MKSKMKNPYSIDYLGKTYPSKKALANHLELEFLYYNGELKKDYLKKIGEKNKVMKSFIRGNLINHNQS